MNAHVFEYLLWLLTDKYGQPRAGRHRITFLSKHCVFKAPVGDAGIIDNCHEAVCKHEQHAKGRIVRVLGYPVLCQERLTPKFYDDHRDIPEWVRCIDCAQVGTTPKGALKAFDFGLR